MKTKVLAALAATMAVGATCAFAANPFVDVPSDSWAYKSVVELADAGIIQGVDGQYFQGNRNITRYEAAEMVAAAQEARPCGFRHVRRHPPIRRGERCLREDSRMERALLDTPCPKPSPAQSPAR